MPVKQRGNSYEAAVFHKGSRYRQSFKEEADAIMWEAETRAMLKKGLTPQQSNKRAVQDSGETLEALFKLLSDKHWKGLSCHRQNLTISGLIMDKLGAKTPVNTIDSDTVSWLARQWLD
ncbi:hypothetical protein LCGC14_2302520, partial [marine sediment metagenome]